MEGKPEAVKQTNKYWAFPCYGESQSENRNNPTTKDNDSHSCDSRACSVLVNSDNTRFPLSHPFLGNLIRQVLFLACFKI